jgi:hypothetical protein
VDQEEPSHCADVAILLHEPGITPVH